MSLHFYPIARRRIKADTRAFKAARENIHRNLRNEIEEAKYDASLPRHFKEHEQFRRQGETSWHGFGSSQDSSG